LQRRTFPGQAFHRTASEKLSESAGTLSVIDKSLPLPSGPLRVAVDGFGFGGANAHMVLENIEATQIYGPAKRKSQAEDELVFISMMIFAATPVSYWRFKAKPNEASKQPRACLRLGF